MYKDITSYKNGDKGKNPRILENTVNGIPFTVHKHVYYDEQSKFEELVLLLAQNSEYKNIELNKEITKFEDAIRNTGCGKAYFGIAKSD